MRRRWLAGMILAAGWAALPALAGVRPNSVELGAFAGAYFADASAGVEDDAIVGGRLAVHFTRLHAVELVVDRVDTTFEGPTLGDLDDRYTSVTASWRFQFPLRRSPIVPYVSVGLGQIKEEVEVPGAGTADDDDLFFPVGAGFLAFTTDEFALRFEGRLKSFTTFDVAQDSFELTVGVAFVLGGR